MLITDKLAKLAIKKNILYTMVAITDSYIQDSIQEKPRNKNQKYWDILQYEQETG